MKALQRLIWKSQDERIHPLAHVFFFITLAIGVFFTFFADSSGVLATVLYTQTVAAFGDTVVSLWGIACLVVTALNTLMLLTRKSVFAYAATYGGYGVWLYAAITYAVGGFWLQLCVTALPNLAFWVWYYLAAKRYQERVEANEIQI